MAFHSPSVFNSLVLHAVFVLEFVALEVVHYLIPSTLRIFYHVHLGSRRAHRARYGALAALPYHGESPALPSRDGALGFAKFL